MDRTRDYLTYLVWFLACISGTTRATENIQLWPESAEQEAHSGTGSAQFHAHLVPLIDPRIKQNIH